METKEILTTQKEVVKNWKGDFQAQACDEGIRYVYKGDMTVNSYCEFLGIDSYTVSLLGAIAYDIEYNCIEGNKYVLKCETYIDNFMNGKLSFELEDNEDYLGFYGETRGDTRARWLPDNWKELMSDEQKEEVARDWCKDNSCELEQYLDNYDKEKVAYDYIDDNPDEVANKAFDKLSDPKDFIKNCIDNL